ncbi:MAG: methyltransferase domain-containing protein [Alphaproteobacteria bacterium]|nr:methyltransferase domain-containing protein [Alphaproteobacteria bacterium]
MGQDFTSDYLLDHRIKIFQPVNGYRASSDAIILSSLVKEIKEGEKVLDIGSGTGAISLCLAYRFRKALITGLEIQPRLAELANLSAKENGFDNVCFINTDIRTPDTLQFGQYDHIITNPPYAENDMPSPNSGKATAHNLENFNLKQWLETSLKYLRPRGMFYTINRAEAIAEIMQTLNGRVGDIFIVPLFSKNNQNAKRVMISARKSCRTPCRIAQGLIVHNEDGTYSEEAQKILRAGYSFFAAREK